MLFFQHQEHATSCHILTVSNVNLKKESHVADYITQKSSNQQNDSKKGMNWGSADMADCQCWRDKWDDCTKMTRQIKFNKVTQDTREIETFDIDQTTA